MHLKPDAVDGDAARYKVANHVEDGREFPAGAFNAVVVVEQQRLRVRLMCPAEGLLDVGCASQPDAGLVVPGRIAQQRAIGAGRISNRLIHNIPGKNLPFVAADHGVDMLLKSSGHRLGCGGLGSIRQPSGDIGVPNQGMAAQLHLLLTSKGGQAIRVREVVARGTWVDRAPFHRVLAFNHVEVRRQRSGILCVAQ